MHEFVHYAAQSKLNNYFYPLWYREAVAEYLATFRLIEDGKVISIGDTNIIGKRAYSLLNRTGTRFQKLDIEDLLKTRSIKMSWRGENDRRAKDEGEQTVSKFYARSVWAYHYLLSSRERSSQTARYIELINQGRSVDSAFGGISYKEMDMAMYRYMTGRQHMHWKYSSGEGGIQFPQADIQVIELNKAGAVKTIASINSGHQHQFRTPASIQDTSINSGHPPNIFFIADYILEYNPLQISRPASHFPCEDNTRL